MNPDGHKATCLYGMEVEGYLPFTLDLNHAEALIVLFLAEIKAFQAAGVDYRRVVG